LSYNIDGEFTDVTAPCVLGHEFHIIGQPAKHCVYNWAERDPMNVYENAHAEIEQLYKDGK